MQLRPVNYTRILLGIETASVEERIRQLLHGAGISTESSTGASGLWEKLTREDFDLVVAERAVLPVSPRELVQSLRQLPEHPALIVLTPEENPGDQAALLAAGCLAVLWLGLRTAVLGETLLALIDRHTEDVLERLGAERTEKRSTLDEFVSSSPAMKRFLTTARRLTRGDSALLILGETGVGKERLARSIHSESRRSSGPFITVNCGALPENLLESELFGHEEGAFTGAHRARRGYFELAHRGTIFLDEIGEMPVHLQVKLLRVLEDRRVQRVGSERPIDVDVRVMAATNRDLRTEMAEKRFRPDLYYRLAVVTLTVPALRDRKEDVPQLARFFLERSRGQLGRPATRIGAPAMQALLQHDWPGNVRELINVIERAVLLCPGSEIRVVDLKGETWSEPEEDASAPAETPRLHELAPEAPLEVPFSEARRLVLDRFESGYLRHHLRETGGRIGQCAKRIGLNERSVYALMKRYGLRKEDFKS